jgi:hypothetical protein
VRTQLLGRGVEQALGHPDPLGDRHARAARDGLGADLRQLAGAVAVGVKPREQMGRDRQRQHAVAEERQPLVRV